MAAHRIRDVWASNLDVEMHNIRELIDRYPYVALDTEFPGVVARPIGSFKVAADYHYQTMRCNVDLLKIIQLGLALSADDGTLPGESGGEGASSSTAAGADGGILAADAGGPAHNHNGINGTNGSTNTNTSVVAWQFNFRFDAADDMYNPEALELLHKAGLDLARHAADGIRPADFAELLITSGLVLNDDVFWISFHSAYDFGYLLRALTAQSLPQAESDFFALLTTWFPSLYDIKCLLRPARLRVAGGLAAVADELGVRTLPTTTASSSSTNPSTITSNGSRARQAGADALLATAAFHALRARAFGSTPPPAEYNGRLYGLGAAAAGAGLDADSDADGSSTNGGASGAGGGVAGVGTALNAMLGMSATSAAAAAAAAAASARAAVSVGMGLTPAERSRSPMAGSGAGAGGGAGTPQMGGTAGTVGGGPMGLAPTPGPQGQGGAGGGGGGYGAGPGGLGHGAPSPYAGMHGPVGVNGAAYHLRQINVGGDR